MPPASYAGLRICLLTTQDLDAVPFDEDDWPCDPRPFLPEAIWQVAVLEKETAVSRVVELSRRGFDLYFNLCDGAWDEPTPGIEVVQTLERLHLPFTGATSEFYEPSREAMKRVCEAWGIDTPAYVLARSAADVDRAATELRFPLFVKHPSSYASVGLTRDSRVETAEALHTQAGKMLAAYGGALIEEFIDGIECTVLVAENPADPDAPLTYTPVQYRFPEGESFKHADLKWLHYRGLESFAVGDGELDALLRRSARRFFVGLCGTGYGRCDLRIDAEGRAQMLEINPNCGLFYPPSDAGSADFCLLHDPAGHHGFIRIVVAAALARHARSAPAWEVRPRPAGGHGLYARRPLAAGDRILVFEESRRPVVSRTRLEALAVDGRRPYLLRTAWPLTDELWVVPEADAGKWKPIAHACEPSAWFEGLDVVARRSLATGEEITLDYATFHNERMPAFECDCATSACRGMIRGADYRRDFVARYGDHISPWVARHRDRGPGTRSPT